MDNKPPHQPVSVNFVSRFLFSRLCDWRVIVSICLSMIVLSQSALALDVKGTVTLGGKPEKNATVTLWKTAGTSSPKSLKETKANADGSFEIRDVRSSDAGDVYYITTRDGVRDDVALMSVLGTEPPQAVVVNELTTVASIFTSARFIDGSGISGNELGLRIAAGNAPNLVDPVTGTWGKVLLDPLNSTRNTTLVRLNTLGSLITAFATAADDAWRAKFMKAATPTSGAAPKDTIEAIAAIARRPWANPADLYALFDSAYPQPKDGSRRSAPFIPYLAYPPADFSMILSFAGGGVYSAGKMYVDADGNIWSGQNWMAGSQSGVIHGIGGGTIKLAPDGTALSPPITGFTAMDVDGIGWGTAVTRDAVWLGGLNGKIGVMNFDGKPIAKESDFPMAGKIGNLMGVGVAPNGDVWIADGTMNNLLHFPGGRPGDGKVVEVAGLKSPFGIVIDAQNRVWVSNALSNNVVRFPADDPSKAESFVAGISTRGMALDSKGNLWVASNQSPDFPPVDIPAGTSIMKGFELALQHMLNVLAKNPGMTTGVVNMIRPDGTQPAPAGFTGNDKINVAWGVSIDGNDDVWVGNFWGRGVVLIAGDATEGHPAGSKTGDAIHLFESGSIQMVTDVVIDPAGNAWVANNWEVIDAVISPDPKRGESTKGGGQGITVIYGVAAPVKTPVMGEVEVAE